MPTTSSAKKRLRQSQEKRIINRAVKHELKTRIRTVRESVQAGKTEDATTAFRTLVKRLDRAAAKGIIHRNKAARTKSRIAGFMKKSTAAS